jgi:hypothetical protein
MFISADIAIAFAIPNRVAIAAAITIDHPAAVPYNITRAVCVVLMA